MLTAALWFTAHLSANPFVDTMRADKPEGGTYQ